MAIAHEKHWLGRVLELVDNVLGVSVEGVDGLKRRLVGRQDKAVLELRAMLHIVALALEDELWLVELAITLHHDGDGGVGRLLIGEFVRLGAAGGRCVCKPVGA